MDELVAELQDQFGVPESKVRDELNKLFDARLLYPVDAADDEEVRLP